MTGNQTTSPSGRNRTIRTPWPAFAPGVTIGATATPRPTTPRFAGDRDSFSQVREVIAVHTEVSEGEFANICESFNSWSALYEWVRAGADRKLLKKLAKPIKVDALRVATDRKPTNAVTTNVAAASTDQLVAELNTRMDDEKVVSKVIDTAVKASTRNQKTRAAATGRGSAPKVPAVATAGLKAMAAMKEAAAKLRQAEALCEGLDEISRDAAATTFESDVVPAYGSLSLTIRGARV